MIISQMIGGLGNQMFQYAVGRAVSLNTKQPFFLDISKFDAYKLHQGFELERIFQCTASIAGGRELRQVLGWQSSSFVRKLVSRPRFRAIRRNEFVVEPHFQYWPGINKIPRDCYLAGYWQSWRYFQQYASIIRSDFSFKTMLDLRNNEIAEKIKKVPSVSLHVRRGDYVSNSEANAVHGVCTLDYYKKSIQYISRQIENPYFFIFSDDINWVKKNLPIASPHLYVEHNYGAESYNDMRLMSLCKHNILANSSFSWWGAWLNSHEKKIVVTPKKWFQTEIMTDDLIPSQWVRL